MKSEILDLTSVRKWGGDPAIEQEYGVISLECRTYRLDNKFLEAIIEKAPDVSSAYGLLTYYETKKMLPEKGMQLTLSGPEGALMGRGRLFIRVPRPPSEGLTNNDFLALLIFVGGTRPSTEDLANLPVALPTEGLVPGSVKYLLGLQAARHVLPSFRTDLIGFSQGAEAQVAAYLSGKRLVTVLAINYPTPQMARVRFGAMEKLLEVNQDRGPGPLYGKRIGSFVFIILGSDSPTTAANVLKRFKIRSEYSLNERYPGDKPISLQMLELILANLIFVFILVGLAVLGGILIVISRRVIGKWFPQSAWGRGDEGTLIRLGLGGT